MTSEEGEKKAMPEYHPGGFVGTNELSLGELVDSINAGHLPDHHVYHGQPSVPHSGSHHHHHFHRHHQHHAETEIARDGNQAEASHSPSDGSSHLLPVSTPGTRPSSRMSSDRDAPPAGGKKAPKDRQQSLGFQSASDASSRVALNRISIFKPDVGSVSSSGSPPTLNQSLVTVASKDGNHLSFEELFQNDGTVRLSLDNHAHIPSRRGSRVASNKSSRRNSHYLGPPSVAPTEDRGSVSTSTATCISSVFANEAGELVDVASTLSPANKNDTNLLALPVATGPRASVSRGTPLDPVAESPCLKTGNAGNQRDTRFDSVKSVDFALSMEQQAAAVESGSTRVIRMLKDFRPSTQKDVHNPKPRDLYSTEVMAITKRRKLKLAALASKMPAMPPISQFKQWNEQWINGRYFQGIMSLATVFALFADDCRLILAPPEDDEKFSVGVVVVFCLFLFELASLSWIKKDYFLRVYFWLDSMSACSLLFDMIWFKEAVLPDDFQLGKTGRAARVGTRVGRFLKFSRLMRVGRLFRMRATRETIELEQQQLVEGESHASSIHSKIAELTTQKVIIIILALLFILPFLETDPREQYLDDALGQLEFVKYNSSELVFNELLKKFYERHGDSLLFLNVGNTEYYNVDRSGYRKVEISAHYYPDRTTATSSALLNIRERAHEAALGGISSTVTVLVILTIGVFLWTRDCKRLGNIITAPLTELCHAMAIVLTMSFQENVPLSLGNGNPSTLRPKKVGFESTLDFDDGNDGTGDLLIDDDSSDSEKEFLDAFDHKQYKHEHETGASAENAPPAAPPLPPSSDVPASSSTSFSKDYMKHLETDQFVLPLRSSVSVEMSNAMPAVSPVEEDEKRRFVFPTRKSLQNLHEREGSTTIISTGLQKPALRMTVEEANEQMSQASIDSVSSFSDSESESEEDELCASDIFEIATIQHSFNALRTAILSFSKYVPKDVVRELVNQGSKAVLGVSEHGVTMCFGGLINYELLYVVLNPNDVLQVIADFYKTVLGVVRLTHGTLIEFEGLRFTCVWNAFTQLHNHSWTAVDAAMMIKEAVEQCRERWAVTYQVNLPSKMCMNMGLHTKSTFIGNIGSRTRMKFGLLDCLETQVLFERFKTIADSQHASLLITDTVARNVCEHVVCRPIIDDEISHTKKHHHVHVHFDSKTGLHRANPSLEIKSSRTTYRAKNAHNPIVYQVFSVIPKWYKEQNPKADYYAISGVPFAADTDMAGALLETANVDKVEVVVPTEENIREQQSVMELVTLHSAAFSAYMHKNYSECTALAMRAVASRNGKKDRVLEHMLHSAVEAFDIKVTVPGKARTRRAASDFPDHPPSLQPFHVPDTTVETSAVEVDEASRKNGEELPRATVQDGIQEGDNEGSGAAAIVTPEKGTVAVATADVVISEENKDNEDEDTELLAILDAKTQQQK